MSKRMIICCDGTWNTAGQKLGGLLCPTNVAKLKDAIPEQDSNGVGQRVYYREGVGTKPWERLRGGAFGYGLSQNVVHAYRFIVDTYEPGDELFLFGFSRGAFTARSLAGMVRKSGILRPGHSGRVRQAWSLYRDPAVLPSDPGPALFRAEYSHETRIRFVGVWDTVGALGVPVLGPRWLKPLAKRVNKRWSFHDTNLSTQVDGAFQALAIDEERSVFEPTLWHQQPDAEGQVLEQAWFAGVHCSVGGGLPDSSLSDLALIWMADRAQKYGLEFTPGAFPSSATAGTADPAPHGDGPLRLAPDPLGPIPPPRTGIYRLTAPLHRPIGQASTNGRLDGCESVASPALERHAKDSEYRPPELVKYLAVPD